MRPALYLAPNCHLSISLKNGSESALHLYCKLVCITMQTREVCSLMLRKEESDVKATSRSTDVNELGK